ncbi:MAG: ABC transporter ATP-binding protein [Verrucomicrobiales bacterium]|nr:ABC transporter ATP-binding protein [Verrucomicrobiales bacterium]
MADRQASPSQAPPRPSWRVGGRNLSGVLAYLPRYPAAVAWSVGLLLVNVAIEMGLPQVIGSAMTQLQRHQDWGAPFEPWLYVQVFVGLVLVRGGVGYILGPIRNRLVQRVLNDLRADMYEALQRQAFWFHDRNSTGELISRSTTDISRLQDFLFACLFLMIDIAAALVATVVLIARVHPSLGVLTVLTLVPTVVLIAFFAARLQPQWRAVHDLHGAMTSVIQENIAGVRVVKAFARERAEVEKFRARKDAFLTSVTRTVNYWAARVPLAQFLFGLTTPLILWVGGGLVIRGAIPVGDFAVVILYLMAIGHRMGMVGQFTNIVQNASASAERILEVVREPRTIRTGNVALPPGGGRVEFRSVSFRHDRDPRANELEGRRGAALHEVTFTVEAGKTVAVVGPTGSGKSTLVAMIPRFHDPESGTVLLDGVDARELRLPELRRSVGYIFQETFLFSATVAENIAYGRPTATAEEIEAAARAAQAHGFIMELERGYATRVGERGVSLSGGQRQRLAIARAFLMNPRWLILDDATASVDSETERLIQGAMRELSVGRTTFVIAQRLSTVRQADWILVLDEGRVVEQGTHAHLVRTGAQYRRIFARQMEGAAELESVSG